VTNLTTDNNLTHISMCHTFLYMASPDSAQPRSRTFLWWGLAVAALILGYADLARGGITVAPILLVLAYCVLIPIAILK
jgi:hypothetical protein